MNDMSFLTSRNASIFACSSRERCVPRDIFCWARVCVIYCGAALGRLEEMKMMQSLTYIALCSVLASSLYTLSYPKSLLIMFFVYKGT